MDKGNLAPASAKLPGFDRYDKKGGLKMEKLFVNVRCDHHEDGTLRPRQIIWADGRTWDIKRTIHVAEPVENEFEGIRYTVLIGSAEKYIYRIGTQWYVHPVNMEVDTS